MYALEAEISQTEPNHAKLFLSSGGVVGAAQAPELTDVAVTDSSYCKTIGIGPGQAETVRVPLAESIAWPVDDGGAVGICAEAKVLLQTSRYGASIDGVIGPSIVGEGAIYLSGLMGSADQTASCPLIFGNWQAHSAVMTVARARIVHAETGKAVKDIRVHGKDPKRLADAQAMIEKYGNGAWSVRAEQLRCEEAPTLTKSIVKVPVGVGDSGYTYVSAVVGQKSQHSAKALDAMLKSAILTELGAGANPDASEAYADFIKNTAAPGAAAARCADTVAGAFSVIQSHMIAYRTDGRSRATPSGVVNEVAELWPGTDGGARNGDCDDSALANARLFNSVKCASKADLDAHPTLRAVHHVIHPHYDAAVAIIGAHAATASADLGGKPAQMAGHAAMLFVPKLSLLAACEKGAEASLHSLDASARGRGVQVAAVPQNERATLARARFEAAYPPEAIEALPEDEKAQLASYDVAKRELGPNAFPFLAAEGTQAGPGYLYEPDDYARAIDEADCERTTAAFKQMPPTVGRKYMPMHVGSGDPKKPWRFYSKLVEAHFGTDHFLFAPKCREVGRAATEVVLSPCYESDRGALLERAGANPRELVVGNYAALPLVTLDKSSADAVEGAIREAARHTMAPRSGPTKLGAFASERFRSSMSSLRDLQRDIDPTPAGHDFSSAPGVCYTLALQGIANNPGSIAHFCETVRTHAKTGHVSLHTVPGLMQTDKGEEAGVFATIEVTVPLPDGALPQGLSKRTMAVGEDATGGRDDLIDFTEDKEEEEEEEGTV